MSLYVVSRRARQDIMEILRYIETSSPAAAERFELDLLAELDSLANLPAQYAVREEWAAWPIRVRSFGSYLIFHDNDRNPAVILRVVHAMRDVQMLLREAGRDV